MRVLSTSLVMAAACLACGGEKADPATGDRTPASPPPTASPTPTAPPSPSTKADAGAPAAEPAPRSDALMQEPFDPEEFEANRPPETGQDGVTKEGARFEDQNGANVVVLIHQIETAGSGGPNSRRLWAYHYIDEGGKRRVLRKLSDAEESCELDNVAGWVDGALQITDADADGLGEVTVAYDLGCVSDVSPKTRKLVVLEDGAKWILRGESRVDTGGGKKVGGAFREDPPAKKWPRALHQHAVAAWARLVDR